jgi:phosphoribosylglycinamide formyltransferase-1
VTEGVDEGPIICQKAVSIEETDTVETLSARILEQEHQLYPQALQFMAQGRLQIMGRTVKVLE